MTRMKTRSWVVPPGMRFVCTPQDGYGPAVIEAGAVVTIAVTDTWEEGVEELREALASMRRPDADPT